MSRHLEMWTVYDHPADFPDAFVARKWVVRAGGPIATPEVVMGVTLEEVRERLPEGLYPLNRNEGDDPTIVETWL